MKNELPEAKVLGKQVNYPNHYQPEILVAVPRALNREMYDLKNEQLPFVGIDAWHAYELSLLTNKGLPVTGVLKIVYPADSPFLVESKSLKLYLNAFNMERYGNNRDEGVKKVLDIIKNDLDKLLKCNTQLSFFNHNTSLQTSDFPDYSLLEESPDAEQITFDTFAENPDLLLSCGHGGSLKTATHLLRSNCKITHQPDWGSVFIYLKGAALPGNNSLLKYIVSIRSENHFHEEICEMIYQRLWQRFKPEELMVTCIYTRRGGIDICPARASHWSLLPKKLSASHILTSKLLRQ
ncbi:NADPH-dependent 7-cyano-7-deazaguanine reductase QueF [Geofilum sp. OHC36d9]|uniref:NADPH-dependent 7-cyano-7-deazaguanine reductase QueF n=1 Tax=Geofilum sp. OHC36d9 TaxID=3458413 RepID=UPI004034B80C